MNVFEIYLEYLRSPFFAAMTAITVLYMAAVLGLYRSVTGRSPLQSRREPVDDNGKTF